MDRLRAWWFSRQGLAQSPPLGVREAVAGFGWMRSVGSANPYLAIHARTGASRAEIERAVEAAEIVEVPAGRGCTYYVAREDAALALRVGATGGCQAEFRMAERHLGVTDEEVRSLAAGIARALEDGPLDPRAISARVAPRNLGEAGKKRGMTSTLSLALGRLQVEGRVRRLPQGGRLDTERFRYALWNDGPKPSDLDEETVAHEVARRYFGWAGPATERELREFTGLSAKATKAAVADLVPVPGDGARLIEPDDLDAFLAVEPTRGRAVLLSSLDPWLHSRRNLPTLLEPSDAARRMPHGESFRDATSLRDLDSHPIVLDGVVVGLWEFDPEAGEIAAWSWRPSAEVDEAIRATSRWIADELGDFRSFSLDSPKSRVPRIERLRSLAGSKVG